MRQASARVENRIDPVAREIFRPVQCRNIQNKEAAMASETPVPVTAGSAFPKGKFFVIEPSFWGGGKIPGVEVVNEDRLRLPGTYIIESPNGDPGQYPERPHLVHVPKMGGMPRDFENLFGMWIVSEALKRVFESVDPEGFAFAACDFTLADGTPGPQYYFCGVLRTLDALDEAASRLKIKVGDYVNGKFYSLSGGANLVFREEVVGSAHIFLTPFTDTVFCDRALRDAVKVADVKGVALHDAADY
ncbi:MAG: DUF1629 domain-containing protein [Lysobacteraceae bacterium]